MCLQPHSSFSKVREKQRIMTIPASCLSKKPQNSGEQLKFSFSCKFLTWSRKLDVHICEGKREESLQFWLGGAAQFRQQTSTGISLRYHGGKVGL